MIQLLYSPFIYEFCHFRNFKERISTQSKKDEVKWRILVEKILRTKGIVVAPFFSEAVTSSFVEAKAQLV